MKKSIVMYMIVLLFTSCLLLRPVTTEAASLKYTYGTCALGKDISVFIEPVNAAGRFDLYVSKNDKKHWKLVKVPKKMSFNGSNEEEIVFSADGYSEKYFVKVKERNTGKFSKPFRCWSGPDSLQEQGRLDLKQTTKTKKSRERYTYKISWDGRKEKNTQYHLVVFDKTDKKRVVSKFTSAIQSKATLKKGHSYIVNVFQESKRISCSYGPIWYHSEISISGNNDFLISGNAIMHTYPDDVNDLFVPY